MTSRKRQGVLAPNSELLLPKPHQCCAERRTMPLAPYEKVTDLVHQRGSPQARETTVDLVAGGMANEELVVMREEDVMAIIESK
jgi:hypothetical protein